MKMEVSISEIINLNGSNHHSILGVFVETTDKSNSDQKLNIQVSGYVRQLVDDNVHNHISDENNACKFWCKLDELYVYKIGGNKLYLIKKLMNLNYNDDSFIIIT